MASQARIDKAKQKYREAVDQMKERSLELRVAQAMEKRERRRLKKLMRELSMFTRLSKKKKAALKKAEKALNAAHERTCAVRKVWQTALDAVLGVGEAMVPHREPAR